jgi:Homeodomain-like domain
MQTTRPTIYATLQRWAEEGVAGLEEKSRARKQPRKATLQVRNEIRKLQQNPLLGEWRMHTALLRIGIEVSPATCGRIMAANRQLYGIEKKPPRAPRPKLEMPFRATRRHEYWSCDVRYIEEHLLPDSGTLPDTCSSSLIQCGFQAPFCSAPTTFHATGMAQPRYTTLINSTRRAFLQGRCIQVERQSRLIRRPPCQNPLQQRSKTGAHIQVPTLFPFFVFSAITPFP